MTNYKKTYFTLTVLMIVWSLVNVFLFSSCGKDKEELVVAKAIEIVQLPSKTNYNVGESLDISGMVIVKKYSNGNTEKVNVTSSQISGFDSSKPNNSLVLTVTIDGLRTTFTVQIIAAKLQSITITALPTKTVYTLSESLSLEGLKLIGLYNDGREREINITDVEVNDFSSEEPAEKMEITISFSEKTTRFFVQILPVKVLDGVLTEALSGYKEIKLPPQVRIIKKSAFSKKDIEKIILNAGLKTIEEKAFIESNIKEIIFPSSLKEIGEYAFYNCKNLLKADLSQTEIEVLEHSVFSLSGITEIKFPKKLKEIKAQAFLKTSQLSAISLPAELQTIGQEAFRESGIKSAQLPNNLLLISERSFYICSKLERITTFGTKIGNQDKSIVAKMSDAAFEQCPEINEFVIPERIEEIGATILNGNNKVKSIIIPSGVKKIKFSAFGYSGIREVSVKAIEPPIAETFYNAWYGFPKDVEKIVVPTASLEKYKKAIGWVAFKDSIIGE